MVDELGPEAQLVGSHGATVRAQNQFSRHHQYAPRFYRAEIVVTLARR